MPYEKRNDLPKGVRDNLPEHAQNIYQEAFNSAEKEYDEESRARRVARSSRNTKRTNKETGFRKISERADRHADGTSTTPLRGQPPRPPIEHGRPREGGRRGVRQAR